MQKEIRKVFGYSEMLEPPRAAEQVIRAERE
jgi:hypothetical protein